MQKQKAATLATIFSDVLANLAFMYTDEEPKEASPDDPWLETTIGYRGPTSGNLQFRCTRAFTKLLAANLLGTDPDDPDTEQNASDAVKEFMNIVCGQFVTAAHGTEEAFSLTIPEIVELPETPTLAACEGIETTAVSVDGQLVQLSHLPDGQPPAV